MPNQPSISAAEFRKLPKAKGKIDRDEQDLQIGCVRWFYLQYPNELIVHYPAAGKRSKTAGGINRNMGCIKGFPDLMILAKRANDGGLFIELKKPGEKPTKEQFEFLNKLMNKGYRVRWTDNIDEFILIVNTYMAL